MENDRQHGWKDLKHKTLADLDPRVVEKEAAVHGHDGFMPTSVKVVRDGKQTIRGDSTPAPQKSQRGRIAVFKHTGEKVTILKEKIGVSYNGTPIHEVATREGQIFLASENQLQNTV
jgi:hypothetical protein